MYHDIICGPPRITQKEEKPAFPARPQCESRGIRPYKAVKLCKQQRQSFESFLVLGNAEISQTGKAAFTFPKGEPFMLREILMP